MAVVNSTQHGSDGGFAAGRSASDGPDYARHPGKGTRDSCSTVR
jgi:hypothetical protein